MDYLAFRNHLYAQGCFNTMTEVLKQALYRYCELDTMSMVFIWEFFHEMTGI